MGGGAQPHFAVMHPIDVRRQVITKEIVETYQGLKGPRIRCPKCEWQPPKDEQWACSCGHMWHTFDTGGVCPACIQQWESTQCHQCDAWSPHTNWYEY